MKVLAINGSPHAEGNTAMSLKAVTAELARAGIEVETLHVGNKSVRGCLSCGACARRRDERCSIDDEVNPALQRMKTADGLLLGSPVYFSGIAGTMKCFLDRAFYVAGVNRGMLRHKAGAAVVAVRRSGGVATFDALNHYLMYAEMQIPTSNYWNVVHGGAPGEADQDVEGIQSMSILGKNMAWLMKLVEAGRGHVEEPGRETKKYMNFIR